MKTAQLKISDGKPFIDGNYEFKMSDMAVMSEDQIVTKDITFSWCLESPNSISDDEAIKIMAEKIKNDFIEFAKKK